MQMKRVFLGEKAIPFIIQRGSTFKVAQFLFQNLQCPGCLTIVLLLQKVKKNRFLRTHLKNHLQNLSPDDYVVKTVILCLGM